MRAREFTINVPITITINGDEDPVISTLTKEPNSDTLQQNPVMVAPQQQELELQKAELGKTSPVIDKLLQGDQIGKESESEQNDFITKLKALLNR